MFDPTEWKEDVLAAWGLVKKRRESGRQSGFFRRHPVPKGYDNRRLLAMAYLSFVTQSELFQDGRTYLRREYPTLKLTWAYEEKGREPTQPYGWNEHAQIYSRAVQLHAQPERTYLRENLNPKKDRGLWRLSEACFGPSEWGKGLTHQLVWTEEVSWPIIASGHLIAFDDSEFRGHGYSGGLRLSTVGDLMRVAGWLAQNQIEGASPQTIADDWEWEIEDQMAGDLQAGARPYSADWVKEVLDRARNLLDMPRGRGRAINWLHTRLGEDMRGREVD